jgi:septum formation protein
MRLVLASASPRRAHLLAAANCPFHVAPAQIAEVAPPYLTPVETVLLNARAKAEEVAARFPDDVVLGADTLVAFNGKIFGKPSTVDDAFAMLRRLNGRTHEVFSGVWLVHRAGRHSIGAVERTRVHFHRLSERKLRDYLSRIGPLDKAGAYAAQDDRGELIKAVEGSFSNVIGLPMEKVAELLAGFGFTSSPPSPVSG